MRRYGDCQAEYESYAEEATAEAVDPANVDAADVEQTEFENCTSDCSGHEAGFQWAQENDVTDSSECGGNSNSFIEGCEAFAQERADLAEQQAQDEVDDEADWDYDSGP